METDQLGRLRDILEAARLIASYIKNTTEIDFRSNTEKQDAVIRRVENHRGGHGPSDRRNPPGHPRTALPKNARYA
jgi:hypothetical protein